MASVFSVDGVISGLQTRSIVDQLMVLERRPIQLAQQQSDREAQRLKALQAVRSQLAALSAAVARLVERGQINQKSVTTDTPPSSPPVLQAVAGPDALNGSFRVTVSRLATATQALSSGPMGQVVDRTVPLATAGLRIPPVVEIDGSPARFSINGISITVDSTTTLDDGTANSLVAKINAAGAGVTASLVADADGRANNRVQLVSAPGQRIQLGSFGDSSNLLRALNLADAVPTGYTAAQVTGGPVAAGALSTSVTINGVTTDITQSNAAFTAQQNAEFIAEQLNLAPGGTVYAMANPDGTLRLTHRTPGAQQAIAITMAGAGTGLSNGTTQNGTDRVLGTAGLGAANVAAPLAGARLSTAIGGLDSSGNGAFTINGVSIGYRASDSITEIVNRINAAATGATATYDMIQDRIRLVAQQTGAQALALQDVTGNFLAATGLLDATQAIGEHAQFTIDGVNGGQPLTSSSNLVTGYVPGVTLTLRAVSSTPVTVSVAQDPQATVQVVRTFVEAYNRALDILAANTRSNPKATERPALSGDPGLVGIERSLRSLVSGAAVGATGAYRSLGDLGISTGAAGTAAGSTARLKLDEARLATALRDNPSAVTAVLASFAGSVGGPSGVGNVSAVTGSPVSEREDGTYRVNVLNPTSGEVEVRFVAGDGRELMKRTGTAVPGTQNASLIPGLTLTFNGTLAAGEDAFGLTVTARGTMVRMQDYLGGLLGTGRYFSGREDASTAITQQLARRVQSMEERLAQREAALVHKYAALESALARLQSQSGALTAQIARLSPLQ